MKNIPFLTYLLRYWLLLVALIAALLLSLNEAAFQHAGALVYLPVLALGAAVAATLVTHLWFRQTIDADTHDGTFLAQWQALDARTRVILTVAFRAAVFLGCCLIAAALAK